MYVSLQVRCCFKVRGGRGAAHRSEDSNLSQSPIVQCHHRYQHPQSPEGQLESQVKPSPAHHHSWMKMVRKHLNTHLLFFCLFVF